MNSTMTVDYAKVGAKMQDPAVLEELGWTLTCPGKLRPVCSRPAVSTALFLLRFRDAGQDFQVTVPLIRSFLSVLGCHGLNGGIHLHG